MPGTITPESLAARLDRLEGQNRRLRAGLLGVVVVAATALLMGGRADSRPAPIKATSINLYDADGELRGTISDEGIAFFDETGMRLSLGRAPAGGPGLTLLDGHGKRRVGLFLCKEGPVLAFSDASERQRVALAAKGGLSSLVLSDEANRPGVTLGAGTREGSSVVLTDMQGRPRVGLCLDSNDPALLLMDENGKTRASLSSLKNKVSLELLDEDEQVLFSKP
jgi:hypothetical protein